MKYARTKKLVFFNNKGGVGKTTLAFNCAVEFAQRGYKTVLVDLDPQCNLSRLALGDEYYENTIFSATSKTIYDVLSGVVRGGGDVDGGGLRGRLLPPIREAAQRARHGRQRRARAPGKLAIF